MPFDYRQEYHKYKEYYLKIRTQPIARVSVTLLASLLTVALLGIFAIKPTLTTIARLTKDIQDKQKIDKQLESKISALKQAQVNYEEISSQIPVVETALPKKPEFVRLEREIEYLVRQHQVLMATGGFSGFVVVGEKEKEQDKTVSGEKEKIPAETIQFTLTVAGDYEQIKNFIGDLESLDRVITISSVNFSKDTEIEGAQLQATLAGNAYFKNKFEEEGVK